MTLRDRLRGVAIALVLLIGCFPVAVVITLIASPFWSWLEEQFKIEAYGHSGPAEWCYLVTYSLLVIICTVIWWRRDSGKTSD